MKKEKAPNAVEQGLFTYRVSKDQKVFLYWNGQQVKILKNKESDKFLQRVSGVSDMEAQLVMAKVTGNFKRGNERSAKEKN